MNKSVRIKNFFEYYKFIEKVKKEFPDANWEDCLSQGQLDSKLWITDELIKLDIDLYNVFIYGGWYGTLAKFMFECDLNFNYIRSFDLDPTCHVIAETINRPYVMDGWKFKATTFDIFDITYPLIYDTLRRDGSPVNIEELSNTIINTSCEHMYPFWYDRVPKNTLMILQSNNFDEIDEHIDTVKSSGMLKSKYPMSTIIYEGERELQKFDRYMVIGYK